MALPLQSTGSSATGMTLGDSVSSSYSSNIDSDLGLVGGVMDVPHFVAMSSSNRSRFFCSTGLWSSWGFKVLSVRLGTTSPLALSIH